MAENSQLTAELKAQARDLGFDLAGICPAVSPTSLGRFHEWLAAGFAGEMRYLAGRVPAYEHPRHVLDGARSILMLGMRYRNQHPQPVGPGQGRVSRYAWGGDYHHLIRRKLQVLADWLTIRFPSCAVRGVVDSAPLNEREFAQLAGLGWIGKNTLLLNRQHGSWFFLAALLTDLSLAYDEPHATDHCGSCTACLDACPTQAFAAPYVLDARRCISYLTIELKSAVPAELRSGMGSWVFGCDVCQEVCPWNHKPDATEESFFSPRAGNNPLELAPLFHLDDASIRLRFRDSPLWRAKRRGLLRNAAVALGNYPHPPAIPALVRGLSDPEPLVRESCAWALSQYEEPQARSALSSRRQIESDPGVAAELDRALAP